MDECTHPVLCPPTLEPGFAASTSAPKTPPELQPGLSASLAGKSSLSDLCDFSYSPGYPPPHIRLRGELTPGNLDWDENGRQHSPASTLGEGFHGG